MIRILFVCLGNICRSPMAEAVFQQRVNEAGLADEFEIDSAGTGGWHVGDPAHRGTLAVLRRNGIPYNGRARQVQPADLQRYDYLIAMDAENVADLRRMDRGGALDGKLHQLLAFAPRRLPARCARSVLQRQVRRGVRVGGRRRGRPAGLHPRRARAGMNLPAGLAASLEALLGGPPRQVRQVSGGDISQAARVEAAGGTFLVKWHANPPRPEPGWPGMFAAEARGLQRLAATQTLRVPAVLGFGEPEGNSPAFIAMEWIERGDDSRRAAAALGEGLAALHRHTADLYGLDHNNYCGATPQDNTPCPIVDRVLRRAAAGVSACAGGAPRADAARRAGSGWSRSSRAWIAGSTRRPAGHRCCTATCGAATGWWGRTASRR